MVRALLDEVVVERPAELAAHDDVRAPVPDERRVLLHLRRPAAPRLGLVAAVVRPGLLERPLQQVHGVRSEEVGPGDRKRDR